MAKTKRKVGRPKKKASYTQDQVDVLCEKSWNEALEKRLECRKKAKKEFDKTNNKIFLITLISGLVSIFSFLLLGIIDIVPETLFIQIVKVILASMFCAGLLVCVFMLFEYYIWYYGEKDKLFYL